MALDRIHSSALATIRGAGTYLADLTTPTVRLGVTGLARSGKTVLITAIVRSLTQGIDLPFLRASAEGRIVRAYLEPQPDDAVPRFTYEEHLDALAADPPIWPESTRRISELRLTIEFDSRSSLRRQLGTRRLHVDIVDYPGEWLIDLPMLDKSFADWSGQALEQARNTRRSALAKGFLDFLSGLEPGAAQDEQLVLAGARLFTSYLRGARSGTYADPTLGPGRFLLPGDLDGSPLLTFFPLEIAEPPRRGSIAAMLERRFEAYKAQVVKPFFRDHFARIDRQVVLVDALSAIDRGGAALVELEHTLDSVLACFRPGGPRWLDLVLGRRIDRIVLAATKADHLPSQSHDRLEALLTEIVARTQSRAEAAGADVRPLALAALRATREADVNRAGERLPCIVGTPLPGERIGPDTFDGNRSAAIFPGDLPESLDAARRRSGDDIAVGDIRLVRFRPPRIAPDAPTGAPAAWPHIRLDRAIEHLIGDRLA